MAFPLRLSTLSVADASRQSAVDGAQSIQRECVPCRAVDEYDPGSLEFDRYNVNRYRARLSLKIIHKDAPLIKSLWNKCVGERCRLDGMEAYYKIVEIKAPS